MILYEPLCAQLMSIEELRRKEKLLTDPDIQELMNTIIKDIREYRKRVDKRYKRRYNIKSIISRRFRRALKWITCAKVL